jgi:hypothetical protein
LMTSKSNLLQGSKKNMIQSLYYPLFKYIFSSNIWCKMFINAIKIIHLLMNLSIIIDVNNCALKD